LNERKENKMGTMPVNKLLITTSLPIMASMLMQALYNIVDSMYVAALGDDALTAVSLAMPLQTLMIAIAVGTGIGMNALLSRRLGQKRFGEANDAAEHGMFLSVLNWIVFALFGLFFAKPFFRLFTDDPVIAAYGLPYLKICTIFSLGVFMQIISERMMQATGNAFYHMYVQGTGAVVNIILDPILIFGWFGLPAMGTVGAAVATVIAQWVAMVIGITLNVMKNKDIHLNFLKFRPKAAVIREIYRVGVPSMIMQSLMSFLLIFLNKILVAFSDVAVSVLGIYFKLQNFVFMPVFGMTNGLIPIVAYNFGARNKARVVSVIKCAIGYAVGIMTFGTVLFEAIPHLLLMLFGGSEEMLAIGVPALRIVSICFPFAGVSIILGSVFQALRKAQLSMIVSFVRQMIFVLPCAYILAHTFGLTAFWLAFPIAEVVGIAMTLLFFAKVYRDTLLHMDTAGNV